MSKFAKYAYALVAYVIFLGTFLYAIGFVGNFIVPKSIDSGVNAPLVPALIINSALLMLFAVQHSVMARPWFKRWWTKIIPAAIERSTFVMASNAALILLYWQWRPMTATVWSVEGAGAAALQVLFWAGWGVVLVSTFLISHFHLFGLVQAHAHMKGRDIPDPQFTTPGFYKVVRHPIMLGFIVAFWAAPYMTLGHLLFALATTGYILVALQFEERDLVAMHGSRYEAYRQQVRMLLPLPKGARVAPKAPAGEAS
jgi:protein-S-isoprenylcysteine O-methyltransferase Ste14